MFSTFASLLIVLTVTRSVSSCYPFRALLSRQPQSGAPPASVAESPCGAPLTAEESSAIICTLPMAYGDCRGSLPRYFFDRVTSECKPFQYSGCGGNENNFATQLDCQETCQSGKAAASSTAASTFDCSSKPVTGPCRAYQESFAYLPANRSCVMFVYGGCSGNGNRYGSREECEEYCAEPSEPTSTEPTSPPTSPPTTRPPEFLCENPDGLFSDPYSCNSFYRCKDWTPHRLACPFGLVFNPTTLLCDWPRNVPNC